MRLSAAISQPVEETSLASIVPHARQLSISVIVRRAFRMALLFLAARMLGVEVFGTYILLLTVVEMASIASGYGYMDFLTREVAQRREAAWPLGLKITQLRLGYIVPTISLALLILAVLRFPWPVILNAALLALTLAARAFGESAQGLLKGLRRFGPLPGIELVQGVIVMAAALLMLLNGLGLRGVIVAEIMGAVAGAIVSVWSVSGDLSFRSSDSPTLRDLLRSTFAFNVYPFITNLYDRVDVVLLSKLAGNAATGIYSLPYRAFATLQIIPYGVMGALLPVFSSSQMSQGMPETCSKAMKFLYLAALQIALLTLVFAAPVVLFLLGPSYADSIVTIKILIWAAIPAFLNFALNTFLLAAHKEKLFLWTTTTCTAFNIAANLALIPRFSFLAAAAVTVATESLLLAQNIFLAKKFTGHVVLPQHALRTTVIFAIVLAAFWGLEHVVPALWAGSLASAMFAVFVFTTVPGFRNSGMAAARQGSK